MSVLKDPILNRPIREAVLERIASGEIAWVDLSPGRDQRRTVNVKRKLGVVPQNRGAMTDRIEYEEAVRITRAAGLDPVDVGL